MTAINSLIDVAGSVDSPLSGSMSVLESAVLSVQTLCESFLAALTNVPTQDFFKSEFRLPAETRRFDGEQELAPQSPVNVSVGIDVYAIAKQIQDAMDRMQRVSINVPELCSDLVVTGDKMPVQDASVSKEISRELTREYSHDLYREISKETTIENREPRTILPPSLPPSSPEKSKPVSGSRWYRGRTREISPPHPERSRELASIKKEPAEAIHQKTSLSYDIEQSIKRSTLVINEMEDVIKNVVSSDIIRGEASGPSSEINQLQSAMVKPPHGINVQAAVETQEPKGDLRNRAVNPAFVSNMPEAIVPILSLQNRAINSALVSNMAEATAPIQSMQKASAEASANSRSLTDALARNVNAPQGMPMQDKRENSANSEVLQSLETPMAHVSKAMSMILNTYAVAGIQPAVIAAEQVHVFDLARSGARIALPSNEQWRISDELYRCCAQCKSLHGGTK